MLFRGALPLSYLCTLFFCVSHLMEQQSADFFSLLFQEHPIPMWIVAKEDYIIEDVNQAALALFNVKRNEFLRTALPAHFRTDLQQMQKAIGKRSNECFKVGILEHEGDGELLLLETSFKEGIYNGRACYVFAGHNKNSSVGPHKQLTRDCGKEQEELSGVIINSLPGVFYLFDENGKFLRWNKNFETVTGYAGDEIENMIPLDFFLGSDKDVIFERISEVFTTGKAEARACFHTKYNTRIPYHFNGNLIEYRGKRCLIGMGIDVTQQKAAEKEREELLTRFEKLSDNIPGFIYEYCLRKDGSSYFPFTSKGIKDIYGLSPEDVREDSTRYFHVSTPMMLKA